MVATFLDDNKPKTSVASFIDLIQLNLICQMVAKFSWVESERTVSKFRKRKRTFFFVRSVFMYSIKRAHETNKFHVAVVQRRLRNVQKSVVFGKVVVLLK